LGFDLVLFFLHFPRRTTWPRLAKHHLKP